MRRILEIEVDDGYVKAYVHRLNEHGERDLLSFGFQASPIDHDLEKIEATAVGLLAMFLRDQTPGPLAFKRTEQQMKELAETVCICGHTHALHRRHSARYGTCAADYCTCTTFIPEE